MYIDEKELDNFLNYLYDKIEECYKGEVKKAIKIFWEKKGE